MPESSNSSSILIFVSTIDKIVNTPKVKVAQLCPTLCDPMDYIVHGILQARILEWVAFPISRASSQPRDWTQVSHITSGTLLKESLYLVALSALIQHCWCGGKFWGGGQGVVEESIIFQLNLSLSGTI